MANTVYEKLRGIIGGIFQLGIGGPQLNANGTAIEAVNAANNGYAIVRGATPVGPNDLATRAYADTITKPVVVGLAFNSNLVDNPTWPAVPQTTNIPGGFRFYVVTEAGGTGTAVGDLLYDDGMLPAKPVTIIPASEGRTIFTSAALAGTPQSLLANSFYVWDLPNTTWLLESTVGVGGTIREIRMTGLGLGAPGTFNSTTVIPAGAYVTECTVEVGAVPADAAAPIQVGYTGQTSWLQQFTDNNPQAASGTMFTLSQDTLWTASNTVLVTVGGAATVGDATVIVKYCTPEP